MWSKYFALFFLLSELKCSTFAQVFSIVSTKYGPIRGVAVGSDKGMIFTYRGIPYGKAPTGNLRFRPSQPPEPWHATRDALQTPLDCMQTLRYALQRNISEDCLYLNIFSPPFTSSGPLAPVMVWIFGGGFNMGTSSLYDGTALARKGVIVVTLNYRLDAFGFLSTEDDTIPGNFGLLDQILALKWVKENIVSFGGDPGHVTLFGESAGACSVSLLSISPLARGLFKRVIIESGSALSPWCIAYPTASLPPRSIASAIGSKVNCSLQNSNEYLRCLQNVGAKDILQASAEIQSTSAGMVLVPRVENAFGVLPHFPREMLESGLYDHVDTLRGFNRNEAGALKDNFTEGATIEEARSVIRHALLGRFNLADKDILVKQFEDIYFKNTNDPTITLIKTSDAATEFSYVSPTLIELKAVSKVSTDKKHYLYEFDYRKSTSTLPNWATAEHPDELYFVFGNFNSSFWGPSPPSNDDLLMSEQVMTLWTNFAKTGNPTPTGSSVVHWPAFNISDPQLLDINKVSTVASIDRHEAVDLYFKLLPLFENSHNDVVIG